MFFEMLRRTHKGAITCVFDGTDRIQHMFMRQAESDDEKQPHRNVIEDTYRQMDRMLQRVFDEVDITDPKNLVMVISDHGFKPFDRSINLNAWLMKNGYLKLKDGAETSEEWLRGVDWSQTKAYSMGLAGIYFNLAGREAEGIVNKGEEQKKLAREIRDKLTGLQDPDLGKTAISAVYCADEIYKGPYAKHAPELIVGYAPGWRACWQGARGIVAAEVFSDNDKAWSGDHCIDPEAVPGVVFSNHPLGGEEQKARIIDIGPTVLDLFGIPAPRHMDGESLVGADGEKKKVKREEKRARVA
jgi:predicted AlkP superfamily phosphohydrolase/phosphomutase